MHKGIFLILIIGLFIQCRPRFNANKKQRVYWEGISTDRKKGIKLLCQTQYCSCFNEEDKTQLMNRFEGESVPMQIHIQRLLTINSNRSCEGLFLMERVGKFIGSATWMIPFLKFKNKVEFLPLNKDDSKDILSEFLQLYSNQLTENEKLIIEYYFLNSVNTHGADYPYELLKK